MPLNFGGICWPPYAPFPVEWIWMIGICELTLEFKSTNVCPIQFPFTQSLPAHKKVVRWILYFLYFLLCAHSRLFLHYICANVRAYKSCEYADCHCHFVNRSSAVTSDSFSRLFTSLSVSSRGGPSNLVQSHVEQNLVLDQFCEPTPAHKGDNFMESHERRRYYVEILYNTSVFRLCPGRQFISWTVFF